MYEYKVIKLEEQKGMRTAARLDADELESTLNALGRDGWHVVGSYGNPYMRDTGFIRSEHILILEREI